MEPEPTTGVRMNDAGYSPVTDLNRADAIMECLSCCGGE